MMSTHQTEEMEVLEVMEIQLMSSGYDYSLDEFLRICGKVEMEHKKNTDSLFRRMMNMYIRKSVIGILV